MKVTDNKGDDQGLDYLGDEYHGLLPSACHLTHALQVRAFLCPHG